MKYKTSYCSHESLEKILNEASKDSWHLLQILAHENKTITCVFYRDEPKQVISQELSNALDDVESVEVLEPIISKWKFWKK